MLDMNGRITHLNYVDRIPDKFKREPLFPKSKNESHYNGWFDNPNDFKDCMASFRCDDEKCGSYNTFNYLTVYSTMPCHFCKKEVNIEKARQEHKVKLAEFYAKKVEEEKKLTNPCSEIELSKGEINQTIAEVKKYESIFYIRRDDSSKSYFEVKSDGKVWRHRIDKTKRPFVSCYKKEDFIKCSEDFIEIESIYYKKVEEQEHVIYFEVKLKTGLIIRHLKDSFGRRRSKESDYNNPDIRPKFDEAIREGKLVYHRI